MMSEHEEIIDKTVGEEQKNQSMEISLGIRLLNTLYSAPSFAVLSGMIAADGVSSFEGEAGLTFVFSAFFAFIVTMVVLPFINNDPFQKIIFGIATLSWFFILISVAGWIGLAIATQDQTASLWAVG